MKAKHGFLRFVSELLVMTLLTGCGALMNTSQQKVNVSSTPPGANVFVDKFLQGPTPLTTTLKRKKSHLVRIEMEGYQPYEVTLKRKFSGWVFGSVVLAGLIGLAIDAGTGGMYRLSPEEVKASMGEKSASVGRDGSIIVITVLRPEPSWKKIGQLLPSVNPG